jgi:hypothetical protein
VTDADISARKLVEEIWQRAEDELLGGTSVLPPLKDFESLEHNGDLRYLNSHWSIDPAQAGPPRGSEWKQKARSRFAASVYAVLDRYFAQERDFFAHSVRYQNEVAQWCATLSREIRQVASALEDEARRLSERQDVVQRRLEARVAELEDRLARREG